MKLHVVTDASGEVIGTAADVGESEAPDSPFAGSPTPLSGQDIHEIDVPDEIHDLDPPAFLSEVAKYVKQGRK